MDERAFHSSLVKIAHWYGWRVAQFRPARMLDGEWRTPVGGDGKGYPDFTMVRERTLWVECKSEKGRLSDAQKEWIEWLRTAGQEVYVWRPSDIDKIHEVLQQHDPERWARLVEASGGDTRHASSISQTLDRVLRQR